MTRIRSFAVKNHLLDPGSQATTPVETAMPTDDQDFGALIKRSFELSVEKDNLVVLLVGALALSIGSLVTLGILGGPLALGLAITCRKMVRGETATMDDLWLGFKSFGPSFVAMLLVCLAILVGTLLCLVPGLAAAFLFCFTFQAMANGTESAVDAMKESLALVKENISPSLVFMVVLLVVNVVLGFVPFLGSIAGVAFSGILAAVFYHHLTEHSPNLE